MHKNIPYHDTIQMQFTDTSGSGGIDSHAYKLAFLILFAVDVPPNCTATGLDKMSLEE